jgi:hypothetical protein
MILLKSLMGGVVGVVVIWIVITVAYARHVSRQYGNAGAVAVRWDYLFHMPLGVAALTLAFGIGVYLVAKPRF